MNKHLLIKIPVIALAVLLLGGAGLYANAQRNSATSSPANRITQRMQNLVDRANREIERRITGLNKLVSRIGSMKKLSESDRSALSSTVQGQINILNSLKSKIDSDTDLTTLLSEVKSITASYRIYALVIPQGAIMASADRVLAIADIMNTLGTKIQARISQEQSAGKNVSSLQTAMADFNAKIADARTQAQNAVTEISALKPDQGDSTAMKANTQALKDARTKIHAAQQDFVAARKDAGQIVKDLRGTGGETATSTPNSTSSSQ